MKCTPSGRREIIGSEETFVLSEPIKTKSTPSYTTFNMPKTVV